MVKVRTIVFLIASVLSCCFGARAEELQDVVYLKNGSIIRGTIIEQVPNESLKILTGDGSIFVYEMSQIQKMTKENSLDNGNGFTHKSGFSSYKMKSNLFREPGYRGVVDIGGAIGVEDYGDGVFSVSTSHGYQFNPYLFMGAGLGLDYHFGHGGSAFIPIFIDIRGYFLNGRVTPFIGTKVGYSPFDGYGFYFNPSLGVSFAIFGSFGMNVALGYNLQRASILSLNTVYNPYTGYYDYDTATRTLGGVSIKLGLEF